MRCKDLKFPSSTVHRDIERQYRRRRTRGIAHELEQDGFSIFHRQLRRVPPLPTTTSACILVAAEGAGETSACCRMWSN